ncbi:hypothetical protein [uncultured Blautia sp.]|uniref:hypothetical protein n=1 Tax=Blautia parvula TaxID=2877527 RepID=UPI0025967E8D|nr:hypothetical protein [uncultured Blautia sp.]
MEKNEINITPGEDIVINPLENKNIETDMVIKKLRELIDMTKEIDSSKQPKDLLNVLLKKNELEMDEKEKEYILEQL